MSARASRWISGGGALVKNGAGTFQTDESTASSTYSNLTINAGTFAFNKSSSGLGVGALTINGGVIRTTTASNATRSPNNSSILVNADFTLGSSTSTNISFSNGGAWTLANGTRTITVDTIIATITGVVGDGGNNYGLVKSGSGTLVLSSADTYAGPTTISAGNLKLANNLAAGTNSITATGVLQLANGVTVANAFTANQTFECMDVPDAGATAIYTGPIGNSGNGFRFGASGAGATLILSNATVNVTSSGKTFWPTRGNIIYAGNTVINNGSSSGGNASLIGRSSGFAAALTIKDNAVCNFGGFTMGNGGGVNTSLAFTIQDAASLTVGTTNFDLLNTAIAGTTVSLNGGTVAVGSFIKTAVTAETLSLNGGVIKANVSNASFFPSLTGLTANVSTGGALLNDNGFNITVAQPLLHDTALGATADGGLVKSGAGVTTLSGTNTYSGATTVNGGTLLVSGVTGTNVVTVNTNTTLTGTGTLNGATTVAPGGRLQAGLGGPDTSTLTISNSLTLGGNAVFNLNRTNAQTANKVSGLTTVNFGGTLTVTNVGTALQPSDTFTLFSAGSYTGSFATITLPALGAGLSWNTSQLAVNGTIFVAGLPAVTASPASTNLVYGNSAVLTASASGATPLFYQWYDNNTNAISGATNTTLTLTAPGVGVSGNYTVVVTNAYGTASSAVAVTVTPAPLGVTANDTNRVYGAANPAFTASFSGFVNGDTSAVISGSAGLTVSATSTSPTGAYTITAAVGSLTAANYSFVNFTNGTLTITPGALGITASSAGKTYGQTVTFAGTEFSSTGLVGSDSVTSVTLTSAGAVNTATVSGYVIVPSAATGSGLTNYTITYNNGTLTVNPAALGITANSTGKTYGQTVTFAGTEFSTSGLLLSDTVTGVTLTSAGAAGTAPAASYAIVPSAATGSGLGNYSITYNNGTLTVNPLAVILDGTRAYDGTTNANFSILTVTNFIGSDVVTVASGNGGLAAAAVGSQPVTSFGTLALGGAQGTNYTLTGASGAVNITATGAGGTLTSSANPVGFGGSVTFTDTLASGATGYVIFNTNGVLLSSNNLSAGAAVSVAVNLPRGTNAITAIYGGDANYSAGTSSLAQIVTNHTPVATDVTYYRNGGIDLRITIADLLTNVTDVDADTITLSAAGTSTNGVTLFNGSGFLLYHNTNNVLDQFTYTVSDGNGGTATGNVNIALNPFLTGQSAGISVSGSTATVQFFGIPGYGYGVQRSTNLTSWATLTTTNAPANGAFDWTDDFSDLGVVPASAYYRLQWIP
jgi:autotransporter-associated beta strand protein